MVLSKSGVYDQLKQSRGEKMGHPFQTSNEGPKMSPSVVHLRLLTDSEFLHSLAWLLLMHGRVSDRGLAFNKYPLNKQIKNEWENC